MKVEDVEREWIRTVPVLGNGPAGWSGSPGEWGRLLFRSRAAETVFCFAVLFSLPRLAIEARRDPVLRAAGRFLGIATSRCLCAKISPNDTAAIATLRNLASCQSQFQAAARVDVDGDGVGEFGTFGEMTGAAGVRESEDAQVRGDRLNPPVLSPALAGIASNGVVTKSGYCFRIFLPVVEGGASHEGRPGGPFTADVDADAAETRWCAYAWPVAARQSGTRAFFVDESGEVWQTPNADGRYSGSGSPPPFDAARPAGGRDPWAPLPRGREVVGRDGRPWKPTN